MNSTPGSTSVDVGVGSVELPIRYWRTDCFMGIFPADEGSVRAMLPSRRLHPVRVTGGRVAVAVAAYNYLETGVGPYGEIGVSPLVTLDRPSAPLLPLALSHWRGISGFVAHLPVTSRIAREAGRRVWGYPKFVADMDFELRPEYQQVHLAERDQDILRLRVRTSGRVLLERAPLTTYTVDAGHLIRTTITGRAYVATSIGASGGELELGDHPVARSLAELGLGTRPFLTRTFLTHHAVLPVGEDLGPSDRDYTGYLGEEREFGRHTVSYDPDAIRVVTEGSSARDEREQAVR